MIGLCRGEPPLGLLRSFAASSHRQRSPASEPWNKCDNFYENERIITIHSVFCRVLLSIFSGRAHSDVKITWETYAHLYPKEEERAVEILNKL